MKNQLLLTFLCTLFITSIFANKPNTEDFPTAGITSMTGETPFWQSLTQEELMTLSPKEIKEKTGKKLKFKEKIGLSLVRKSAKKAVKRAAREDKPMDGLSVVSFIGGTLALLSLFIAVPFLGVLGFIGGLAGLITGIIAVSRKGIWEERGGKGFAITGLVASGLYIVILILAIILIIAFFGG